VDQPVFIWLAQDQRDVSDKLRLTPEELGRIDTEIVWDIYSGGEFEVTFAIGGSVLDAAAQRHMADVSRLVRIVVLFELVALAFAAWGGRLMRTDPARLGRMLIIGAGGVGVAVLAIGIFAAVAWDSAFTLFHELLFPPGTWMFPADSNLISLYPPDFWYEAAMIACLLVLMTSALLSYAGWRRIRGGRRRAVISVEARERLLALVPAARCRDSWLDAALGRVPVTHNQGDGGRTLRTRQWTGSPTGSRPSGRLDIRGEVAAGASEWPGVEPSRHISAGAPLPPGRHRRASGAGDGKPIAASGWGVDSDGGDVRAAGRRVPVTKSRSPRR
jgi:integral membrane protein (TIGR01906 family)